MTFFSIIIPTYNRVNFLPKAIESIIEQSFSDWEIIIINDGSTDNSREIIEQYSDERIKYIYQENSERSAARNNGIQNGKGEYVIFLDSDDYLFKDFLVNLYNEIVKSEGFKQLYFYKVLLEQKNDAVEILFDEMPVSKNIVKYLLQEKKVVSVSQAAIPREFLINNNFEAKYSLWEDTHLFLRLLVQFSYKGLQINGIVIQKHINSTVVRGMSMVRLDDVNRYMNAIDDLYENYWQMFEKLVNKRDFISYKDAKLNMYLYQARVNKQFKVAYSVAFKLLVNRFNLKNFLTFIKLIFHNVNSLSS